MKKIINNKRYDTDTAKKVAEYDSDAARSDFNYYHEDLYQKRTGEFFLYSQGNAALKYSELDFLTFSRAFPDGWQSGEKIIPLTVDEAREWAERTQDADTTEKIILCAYESIFGVVDEDDSKTVTTISLSKSTLKKLKEIAADYKISKSAVVEGLVDSEYDKSWRD